MENKSQWEIESLRGNCEESGELYTSLLVTTWKPMKVKEQNQHDVTICVEKKKHSIKLSNSLCIALGINIRDAWQVRQPYTSLQMTDKPG